MKKALFIIPIATFLMACGNEQIDTGSMDAVLEVGDQMIEDSVSTEELLEEDALRTFELIEDYCVISSKDELYDLFDEKDLEDAEAWYAEGTVKLETTTFTNPANGHKVLYVWKEDFPNELGSIEFDAILYDESYN